MLFAGVIFAVKVTGAPCATVVALAERNSVLADEDDFVVTPVSALLAAVSVLVYTFPFESFAE